LINLEASFKAKEQWAFRGQDTRIFPETSLYRHCKGIARHKPENNALLEARLIRDFARSYHHKGGQAPPEKGNTLEWIALMQHHGAPTRLVDFSYSFFVAVYFALEKASRHAVVWALRTSTLRESVESQFAKSPSQSRLLTAYLDMRDGDSFRKLFMQQPPQRFVCAANPIRMNERMTIQQGVFLAPGNVGCAFKRNVRRTPGLQHFIEIVIDISLEAEILRKLYGMGINNGTLFPGLDGYARSLREKSLILLDLPGNYVQALKDLRSV
jgi:hypothetical protein